MAALVNYNVKKAQMQVSAKVIQSMYKKTMKNKYFQLPNWHKKAEF